MQNFFERVVLISNNVILSIEAILVDFISFYKYLMQDCDYEKAAYVILQSLNYKQKEDIFAPLEQISEEPQSVLHTIEELVSKNTLIKRRFKVGHIKKLKKPINLLRTTLRGLVTIATVHVEESYKRMIVTIKERLSMHTVKQANFRSWENQETKKLYADYYVNLIALSLSCKNVKSVFEYLLLNFQSVMHDIFNQYLST